MNPRREDFQSAGWWGKLPTVAKALVAALTVAAGLVGLGAGWGVTGQKIMQIPARVTSLEQHDVEQDGATIRVRGSVEGKIDSIQVQVAEIRGMLLDMNCEQSGHSRPECRDERLRGR